MMEKTLALVKPNGVEKNHVGEILDFMRRQVLRFWH